MAPISRRRLMGVVGGTGLSGLPIAEPGATSDQTSEPEETNTENQSSATTSTTSGRLTMGMTSPPQTLNILKAGTSYSYAAIEPIYDQGVLRHPSTQKIVPWAFESWTLSPSNVGTSSPTIVGTLRSDMSFTDGVTLTAEDVKFTVEYIKSQKPDNSITAEDFASVSSVTVDDPKGTTVNFFLSQKDNGWADNILGTYILPKHIWSGIADHESYEPRHSGGPIGSGAFKLDSFDWNSWLLYKTRTDPASNYQLPKNVDFLDDAAPFMDEFRIEIFGIKANLVNAIHRGTVDVSFESTGVGAGKKARDDPDFKVFETDDDGWNHYSFNLRRVPLDDPAFRQLLVKLFDNQHVVEDIHRGLGSEPGDYVTPKAYDEWRPPQPTDISDYDGIPVPDLTFPGDSGSFQLDGAARSAARDFLVTHGRAKHSYSFKSADVPSAAAPDGKVLHVNGVPLTEAHTDNDGNANQGPLEVSFNPPQHDRDEAIMSSWWIGALKLIGVPIRPRIETFNSQIPKIYRDEDFDIFAMGWASLGANNDHYKTLFGRWGADVSSSSSDLHFNAMGYTGADSLIEKQATMMDQSSRKPIVKKVLARIWADAPTLVMTYANVIQLAPADTEGWIQKPGGISNQFSWLNVRPVTSPPSLPGFSNPPTDPDGDGLYEDVTGDGTFDNADVEALYEHLESDVVQTHSKFFDFNRDGVIDVGDVQALYNELTGTS